MADISKIDNGTEYNLKDATARAGIESSKTLKSSIVTVNDAAPINAEDITVDITPVQLGSGTPSPDNIRPIEGWTGAGLDRCGKNWFDVTTYSSEGLTASLSGDILTITGKKSRSRVFWIEPNVDKIFRQFTLSFTINSVNGYSNPYTYVGFVILTTEGTARYNAAIHPNSAGNYSVTATLAEGESIIRIDFNINDTASSYSSDVTFVVSNIQLEAGQNATAYEPYQGKQYTADFGETVHGGKWHVTEGGTDKTYGNIASYNGETINEPWLSSMDEYSPGATPTTGAQVVYPLTTPTTISTPKQNVPMLQGINTVSADCGDTSLKYQPDNVIGELKGEIQKANNFVERMALREGSGAKDFSYGGWSFRLYIYRSMGQISMSVERISASSVTEQAVVKVFNGESDYRAPEELRPRLNLVQAATYTTPSGWAIQVYLKDDGYIMFTGIAPEVGASAPTSSNWNLVEPWATHQQAKDLFNN